MKKNGFTLTEMIAVIVIIGVILLITIPVMNRVITNNKEEKYKFYVETVEKAVYSYGDLEFPMTVYELDGSTIKENYVNLSELISKNYLKEFNEDGVNVEDVTFIIKKEKGKVTIGEEIKLKFGEKSCTKTSCS